MSFGPANQDQGEQRREVRLVPAVTWEALGAFVVLATLFGALIWIMGPSNAFKTMMATAHDLLLNTVLFLMAVMILAGAFTSLVSEFGLASAANRLVSPLMRPLFGLPGVASVGVVATYLCDNPAIMPLALDKGFLKYFRTWQVTTLVNLGTVFGMGLIVTTFMLAQSTEARPLTRAVLLGNVGALLGGLVGVRLMGLFGRRAHGSEALAVTEEVEGYDLMRFREVRPGNRLQRTLQSLLDGGSNGVRMGLGIMPGVVVIATMVMMLAYGPGDGGYTGAAYEGIAIFPWMGARISFVMDPLFGFSNPEAIAFVVTSWGSVGAALAVVPQFLETGLLGAEEICVLTGIGICNAGFLSTHVGMMDAIGERALTNVAISTHFLGGLVAGVASHALFSLFG